MLSTVPGHGQSCDGRIRLESALGRSLTAAQLTTQHQMSLPAFALARAAHCGPNNSTSVTVAPQTG